MPNPLFQVEEANYVSNRGYMFWQNKNLPSHYHPVLRNHKNFSYGNQAIVPHEPHQLSTTIAPLGFQIKELRVPIIKGTRANLVSMSSYF